MGTSPKVDAVCTLQDQDQLQKKNWKDLDELFFSFDPTLTCGTIHLQDNQINISQVYEHAFARPTAHRQHDFPIFLYKKWNIHMIMKKKK